MFEADRRPSSSQDHLLACCEWIVDAHAAEDPQQAAFATVELYRYLADHGWVPPPRALLALWMHDAAVDAGLRNLQTLRHATGTGPSQAETGTAEARTPGPAAERTSIRNRG